jgi:lipid-binding SYLF domain-containing protein
MKRRTFASVSAIATLLTITGCSTTSGSKTDPASKRAEIDAGVTSTLNKLFASAKGSRELAAKAQGILVFPSVIAAGLVVGGEYGEGALRVGGATVGYYSTAAASFGLQIGAQSKAVIFMFMTKEALDKFRNSKGWTAGVDGSVALAKIGANGDVDTSSVSAPVIGFVLTNAGLMANLTLEGTKVSKLDL